MNLGIELRQGSLIGATPMDLQADNTTGEPIILSLDSQETRDRILKAAADKGLKGAGSFPISGQEKLHFSEPRVRQRTSGKKNKDVTEESNPELANTRQKILLDLRMRRQSRDADRGAVYQNKAGLTNLTEQVIDIISRSRIDTPEPRRTEKVCLGTIPMDTPHDLRGRINERQGVEEVCLGTVPMESQESSQESQDDDPTKGSNIGPIPLWETPEVNQPQPRRDDSDTVFRVTDKTNTYLAETAEELEIGKPIRKCDQGSHRKGRHNFH